MTLLVCWVLFPLVLGAVSCGLGLLIERASGIRLGPALLVPVGFAALVVAAQFTALTEATAKLAVPLIAALGVAGLGSAYPWKHRRPDPWVAVVGLAVFAVFAAPVALSGEATFAGYIKLDDTATFLALVDRALEHGRSLEGLAPSSYEATVALNLPYYPLGSLLPLGIGAALVGQDPAWVFQPYIAFLAALLGLALYELSGLAVSSRPLRAAAAFVAAQPALLFGYALWGGVKELASAPLIALVAALTVLALREQRGPRRLLPLALAAAALIGVLSVGAAVWLVPAAGVLLFALVRSGRLWTLVWATGLFALLALPSLTVARFLLSADTNAPLRDQGELGNLLEPLSIFQLAGIWPVGDFRFRPGEMAVTYLLIAVVVVSAVLGVLTLARARSWGVALYAGMALGAAVAFQLHGSPWVAAKAFAVGAPAVVLLAAVGAAALYAAGRRVEGAVLGSVVALGVIWSNALAYGDLTLAPRAQLAELEQIGELFGGTGPLLMTEYQPYGVRHFLRDADPEGASELRRRLVPLRDSSLLEKGAYADLDALRLDAVLTYRTLVLRRSPLRSRPPAPYRRVWRKRFYEVWQRPVALTTPVDHLPLGDSISSPVAEPACNAIGRLARTSGGRRLIAAEGEAPIVLALAPLREGSVDLDVAIPDGGRWELWVGGSFRGALSAVVDGRKVGSTRHQLNNAGQYTPLGSTELAPGMHRVRLSHDVDRLRPGTTGAPWRFGPLVLSRDGDGQVLEVPLHRAARLCGKPLDWVELVR